MTAEGLMRKFMAATMAQGAAEDQNTILWRRISQLENLLRKWQKAHTCNLNPTQWHEANSINDYRCDLCKHTDELLGRVKTDRGGER